MALAELAGGWRSHPDSTLLPAVGALFGTSARAWRGAEKTAAGGFAPPCEMRSPSPVAAHLQSARDLQTHLRFGKLTETGFQFQLVPDLHLSAPGCRGEMFDVKYLAPNALYYSLAPAGLHERFPFLGPRAEGRSGEDLHWRIESRRRLPVGNITAFLVAAPSTFRRGGRCVPNVHAPAGLTQNPIVCQVDGAPRGALGSGTTLIAVPVPTAFSTLAYRHVTNRSRSTTSRCSSSCP